MSPGEVFGGAGYLEVPDGAGAFAVNGAGSFAVETDWFTGNQAGPDYSWNRVSGPAYSNGHAMRASPDSGNPAYAAGAASAPLLKYRLNLPSGAWRLYALLYKGDASAPTSFHAKLGSGSWATASDTAGTGSVWTAQLSLGTTSGVQELLIQMRHPGVVIDRLVISTSAPADLNNVENSVLVPIPVLSPRVARMWTVTGPGTIVKLCDPGSGPSGHRLKPGSRHIVLYAPSGGETVSVLDPSGDALATIPAGNAAGFGIAGGGWIPEWNREANVGHAAAHAGSYLGEPAGRPTYEPDCPTPCEGDPCDGVTAENAQGEGSYVVGDTFARVTFYLYSAYSACCKFAGGSANSGHDCRKTRGVEPYVALGATESPAWPGVGVVDCAYQGYDEGSDWHYFEGVGPLSFRVRHPETPCDLPPTYETFNFRVQVRAQENENFAPYHWWEYRYRPTDAAWFDDPNEGWIRDTTMRGCLGTLIKENGKTNGATTGGACFACFEEMDYQTAPSYDRWTMIEIQRACLPAQTFRPSGDTPDPGDWAGLLSTITYVYKEEIEGAGCPPPGTPDATAPNIGDHSTVVCRVAAINRSNGRYVYYVGLGTYHAVVHAGKEYDTPIMIVLRADTNDGVIDEMSFVGPHASEAFNDTNYSIFAPGTEVIKTGPGSLADFDYGCVDPVTNTATLSNNGDPCKQTKALYVSESGGGV